MSDAYFLQRHGVHFGAAPFGGVHFSAGFGFPGIFGLQVAGGQLHPQMEPLTPQQEQQAFLSRLFLMFGSLVLIDMFML